MKATPFELVFGQPPRTTIFPGVTGHVMEEEVADLCQGKLWLIITFVLPVLFTLFTVLFAVDSNESGSDEAMNQAAAINPAAASSNVLDKVAAFPPAATAKHALDDCDGKHVVQVSVLMFTVNVSLDFTADLGTSEKHLKRRKVADEHYRLNAKRMGERYNTKKKVHTFEVGDKIALRVPRIDRAATDLHRLPCIIVQRLGKKYFLYRLRCEYGILDTTFPDSQLETYSGSLQLDAHKWETLPKISLREAAKKSNPENRYYGTSCNCKKGCTSKKCSCQQAGKPCSTRCHSGVSCSNCRDTNSAPSVVDSQPSSPSSMDMQTLSPKSITSYLDVQPLSPLNVLSPSPPPLDLQSPTPASSKWWVQDLGLTKDEKACLENGRWLNDRHISAAQTLLQQQFPHICGLQSTLLGTNLRFSVMPSEGVQILHCSKHWICISTIGCSPGHVRVYDSLFSTLSSSAVRQVCNLLHSTEPELTVHMMNVQVQSGGSDCGLFAIAYAHTLCLGQDPCSKMWTQDIMRRHLVDCFSHGLLSPFPSASKQQHFSSAVKNTFSFPLFCSCRMPEDKKGMAQCVECQEWYHQKCHKIPRSVFTKKEPWCCPCCVDA